MSRARNLRVATSLLALSAAVGGGGGGASAFSVGGLTPDMVMSYITESDNSTPGEYFLGADAATGFENTHSMTIPGAVTMIDSTGALCWNPQNLQGRSVYDGTNWGKSNATLTANAALAPDGTMTAMRVQTSAGSSTSFAWPSADVPCIPGVEYKIRWWAKNNGGTGAEWRVFDVSNSTNPVAYVSWFADMNGSDWTLIEKTLVAPAGCTSFRVYPVGQTSVFADLYLWGLHVVPNNLPVASNPDLGEWVSAYPGGEAYVPTPTASPVYLPRRQHHYWNGSAWVLDGCLIEGIPATQQLHTTNALVTQSLTVTAITYTLHFTGTGSITLSGAHSATLNGTGTGENNRVSLTFVPSAGTLTLTVSGTVTNAQLEASAQASSYIPNLAASGTVARLAEVAQITNTAHGCGTDPFSVAMDVRVHDMETSGRIMNLYLSSGARCSIFAAANLSTFEAYDINSNRATVVPSPALTKPAEAKMAARYGASDIQMNVNGAIDATPGGARNAQNYSTTTLRLAHYGGGGYRANMTIRQVLIWKNAELDNAALSEFAA